MADELEGIWKEEVFSNSFMTPTFAWWRGGGGVLRQVGTTVTQDIRHRYRGSNREPAKRVAS
jgi:hypothetical protein